MECLLDWVLRVGRAALDVDELDLDGEHEHYGPSLFAIGEDQPTAGELAQETCNFLVNAGVVRRECVSSLGRGKILRKAVSTMLHSLPSSPLSDACLGARILHSRQAWQRAYTIARCDRHTDAWLALTPAARNAASVADIVRL